MSLTAGRILMLNGTSSSGKTTIVRALQSRLAELWLEMGIDRFAYALPGRVRGEPTWPLLFPYVPIPGAPEGAFAIETTLLGERFVSAVHVTAVTLAKRGLNVIVDHVMLEARWFDECRRLWSPYSPLYVRVSCPRDVLLQRASDGPNSDPRASDEPVRPARALQTPGISRSAA